MRAPTNTDAAQIMRIDAGLDRGIPARAWHFFGGVLFTILFCSPHICAQMGPKPPCGSESVPSHPSLGEPAIVKAWSTSETGEDWKPPECTGWTSVGFGTLVTVTARFRTENGAEGLLRRLGAISQLKGIRYWSVTQKQWRTLVVDAYALSGDPPKRGRDDFGLNEMTAGSVLYYEQVDNRSGKAVYRAHILEASAEQIVIEVENVSTIHYLLLPVFRPAELQSICFLNHDTQDVWRYYSIVRTARNVNRLLRESDSSAVNRAVAFYRYEVGIPTDQEPPAAR